MVIPSGFTKSLCALCNRTDALMWIRKNDKSIVCQDCSLEEQEKARSLIAEQIEEPKGAQDKPIVLRKSTRMARSYKTRSNQSQIKLGRGKRKSTPKHQSTGFRSSGNKLMSCSRLFVGDNFIQIGDIVSIMNFDDKVYFAQLIGLFVDSVGEHSALISWLLPVKGATPGIFQPEYYAIGPSEDSPRKLTGMVFERRLPSSYLRYGLKPAVPDDLDSFQIKPVEKHTVS